MISDAETEMKPELVGCDRLVHATAFDRTVRAVATITTELVGEAARRHGTSPTATAALGRTLTAALLMGSMVKDFDRVTIQFDGKGPIGSITAEADAYGNVRGYVKHPLAELPLNDRGKFDVSGLVGEGMLHVLREGGFYELGLRKEPYSGSVPIVSGEIAKDIAYYLTTSEQIPSAVSLGVFVLPNEQSRFDVAGAGGFLLQVLPGADERLASSLEVSVASKPAITDLIRSGRSPEEILQLVLDLPALEVLERREVRFKCNCSYDRAVRIIGAIDPLEGQQMLEENGGAEMICHFCSSVYQLSADTLGGILEGIGQDSDSVARDPEA